MKNLSIFEPRIEKDHAYKKNMYYFRFAFDWTNIDEYARADIPICFDSTTQHDIITSQREIVLPFTTLYFQMKPFSRLHFYRLFLNSLKKGMNAIFSR